MTVKYMLPTEKQVWCFEGGGPDETELRTFGWEVLIWWDNLS